MTSALLNRRSFGLLATGTLATLAVTRPTKAQLVQKYAAQLTNGEFNWFPDRSESGPLLIIVSIPDQKLYVYRNGIRVAASTCSTGKPGHATPTGVFTILQKDKNHHSSTYDDAPMPNMNRLTWSGIALHAGNLPGYPASHGCVRLPLQFSSMLFGITKVGMTVVIADDHSFPTAVTHPGMVLGANVDDEFHAVQTTLMQKAYTEGQTDTPSTSALVVSGADKTVTVIKDGQTVATAPATIKDPDKPIGDRVYNLVGANSDTKSLTWSATSYGPKESQADTDADALRRISVDWDTLEEGRKSMQMGMALVTTDKPASPETRTASDFVVIDGPEPS